MALRKKPEQCGGMAKASHVPAPFGALDPEVATDILNLRDLVLERRASIAKMTGRPSWRDPLRDELLRLVVINHAGRTVGPTTHYYAVCRHYASAPIVRRKIEELVRFGLLTLAPAENDQRSTLVWPTEKLIGAYNSEIPAFRRRVIEMVRAYL